MGRRGASARGIVHSDSAFCRLVIPQPRRPPDPPRLEQQAEGGRGDTGGLPETRPEEQHGWSSRQDPAQGPPAPGVCVCVRASARIYVRMCA